MNVIVLEDSFKAGLGGGQQVSLNVIKLLKNDFEVYVFDTSMDSVFISSLKQLEVESFRLSGGGTASVCFLFDLFKIIYSFFCIPKNLFFVFSFLKARNIKSNSLIYVTTKKGLVLAFLLKFFFDIDYVYHAHMSEGRFIGRVVCFLTRCAFKVICVSSLVKKQFRTDNAVVISNSIHQHDIVYKSIIGKDKVIVATISSLNKIKGIEYFVQSYGFLGNSRVEYHIYGDGPLRKILDYNFENIIFKGYIAEPKEVLLSEIDILVVPTIIQESFGLVILEALSCGVPVIATNIGMQRVHIENSQAGELINIKSAKEIAEKIENILSCGDKYIKYSENGLKYSRNFDVVEFDKKIIRVFKSYDFASK